MIAAVARQACGLVALAGVLAVAGCDSGAPPPQPEGGGGGAPAASRAGEGSPGGDGSSSAPSPTSPFAYGPGGWAALGPAYCVTVVRPPAPWGVQEVVRRLGGGAASPHPYREDADGARFRAGAEDLLAATPGRDDRGSAVYRLAEQSGAWTIWQVGGRRCIADATLARVSAGGGRAMAYTRDVDGESRLAYAEDGTLLVNLNPGILPDHSGRRGARPGALSDGDLSELQVAAENELDLDVPAAGLIERTLRVRLDDRWLAGPSQVVTVPAE